MKRLARYGLFIFLLPCCKQKEAAKQPDDEAPQEVRTPVTVTTVSTETLFDSIQLTATSSYTQDNIVKSNINGYIQSVNIKPGQYAVAGRQLFALKTKEAESLGNTISKLDPSFHFTGIVVIHAPHSGYITQLDHQAGDYVQDGEQLAVISNSNSFGFVLNIPYEYHSFVQVGKQADVALPDGTLLKGTVAAYLPFVDSVSQTQTATIKVSTSIQIPENLIVKVRLLKTQRDKVMSLPKEAILTDESQSSFWVMKLIDSITAVKVNIVKGLEAGNRVEIKSLNLKTGDKILISGNYGLPDTAKVKVVKEQE